jgi:hypothetical protein
MKHSLGQSAQPNDGLANHPDDYCVKTQCREDGGKSEQPVTEHRPLGCPSRPRCHSDSENCYDTEKKSVRGVPPSWIFFPHRLSMSNDPGPGLRDAWIATGARWPGSLQRRSGVSIVLSRLFDGMLPLWSAHVGDNREKPKDRDEPTSNSKPQSQSFVTSATKTVADEYEQRRDEWKHEDDEHRIRTDETTNVRPLGTARSHFGSARTMTPNAKVSDGSQPPMTFDFYCERNGWLPFAAPSGSAMSLLLRRPSFGRFLP